MDLLIPFLFRRNDIRRRKCTTTLKPVPPLASIHTIMEDIAELVRTYNITPECIFNEDETGLRWSEALLNQYVPKNAQRAVTPEGDESGRFTALLASSATGEMLPLFQVVKVSCKKKPNDLSKSRVLTNLLKDRVLFSPGHRFLLKMWT